MPTKPKFIPAPTADLAAPGWPFSAAGEKLTVRSGILELMDDLGLAMTTDPGMRMLGGGNPAAIPGMVRLLRERMSEMLANGEDFDRMLGNYDPPQGNPRFLGAMANLLRRTFGWDVGPENIAITCGGQSAFFYLFSLLGGRLANGRRRKILFPLTPEYIGYADQGIEPDLFIACRPRIEIGTEAGPRFFKYHIDFSAVEAALSEHDIAAIAASRPTNPSGNVLTDEEVRRLSELARERGIPLILDNAYSAPFPGILFAPAEPYWAPHAILTFGLSKLGLPGSRTGIVVAPPQIASAVASMTAILGLANGNVGQQLVLPWIQSGRILDFGPGILQPFYAQKSRAAIAWTHEFFEPSGLDWALHANEGTFFLWLWLRNLKITTKEFYQRLKRRKVLTVPGEYFFFGMQEDWHHRHECLRLNYSQSADMVREGLQIIANEACEARR
jgi:valine--pyruvate aminotransferase